jgi:hypothetical protein
VKYVLWGIVGLVAIVVAFLGVGYYWTTHAKVDFKDPQVAGNFKQTFNDNCVHTAQNRAKQSGATLTAEQLDKLSQACTCTRDAVVDSLSKREPMTVMEIAEAVQNDPEIKRIGDSCIAQFGLTNPG